MSCKTRRKRQYNHCQCPMWKTSLLTSKIKSVGTFNRFVSLVVGGPVETGAMLSLDEPLDLKLPSGRTDGPLRLGKRTFSSSICAPLNATRPRLIYTTFPSPPSSPGERSCSVVVHSPSSPVNTQRRVLAGATSQ